MLGEPPRVDDELGDERGHRAAARPRRADVMDGGDAGVGEGGGEAGLAEEPGADVGVEPIVLEHLHRDAPPRPVLPALVDAAESPLAEEPEQFDAVDGEIRGNRAPLAIRRVGLEAERLRERPLDPVGAEFVAGEEPLEPFEPRRIAGAGPREERGPAGGVGDGERPLEEFGVVHQASPCRRASRGGSGVSSSQRQASQALAKASLRSTLRRGMPIFSAISATVSPPK